MAITVTDDLKQDLSANPERVLTRHHTISGSKFYILDKCPGPILFKDKLPPDEAGEDAKRGTAMHDLSEKHLNRWVEHRKTGRISLSQLEEMYQQLKDIGTIYTEEEIGWVNSYRDAVIEKLFENSITGKLYGFETDAVLDHRLDIGGLIDAWVYALDDRGRQHLKIGDFKSGRIPVPVKGNLQLPFYAACLLEHLRLEHKITNVEYVDTYIIQPRVYDKPQHHRYSIKQLDTFKARIYKAAAAIFNEKAKLKAGKHCQYCPAKTICPKYSKHIKDTTALSIVSHDTYPLPPIETLSDEEVSNVILHLPELEAYLAAFYKHGLARGLSGNPLPGTKIVETETRSCWQEDTDSIVSSLKAYVPEDILVKKKLISIGDAKKALLSVCESKKEVDLILASHLTKTTPSLKLVPIEHESPAVVLTSAKDKLADKVIELDKINEEY